MEVVTKFLFTKSTMDYFSIIPIELFELIVYFFRKYRNVVDVSSSSIKNLLMCSKYFRDCFFKHKNMFSDYFYWNAKNGVKMMNPLIKDVRNYFANKEDEKLLESVTHLTFRDDFNQSVDSLPSNLNHLTFNFKSKFN